MTDPDATFDDLDPEVGPPLLDLPVGIDATGTRTETDSLGPVEVPAQRYWGAQTQRSLEHFSIGNDRMPTEVYRAYGYVKRAAATVNAGTGRLAPWIGRLIGQVCDELIAGDLDDELPLFVWQTGSGTQTNMNVNEVISNRCIQLTGGELGSKHPVHPNDHVNMSQSSNDTFPTAMHIAGYTTIDRHTLPAVRALRDSLDAKSQEWATVVKIGRTHLQDATPLTVGQEWSAYVGALDDAIADLEQRAGGLLRLAIGGTAVGTGINAPVGFGRDVAAALNELTGDAWVSADNKFTALATSDAMVRAHAALKGVAVTLYKIANDLRWLGSGPRTGLRELQLPANEPGSSIMPGKVNPTQAEALLMVCLDVIASDVAVSMAGAEGNLQLNTYRPLIIYRFLHSARTLADAADRFRRYLVEGTTLRERTLQEYVDRSVMMVTALSPHIGYDKASAIAHHAVHHDMTLRDAAIEHGVDHELYERVINPLDMTNPRDD